jgi:hypothetical protein
MNYELGSGEIELKPHKPQNLSLDWKIEAKITPILQSE